MTRYYRIKIFRCKTNTAEKEQAIKDADARSDELTAAIEENAAKKAKNEVIIKKAKKDIAKLRSALEKASVGVALSEIRHFLAHDPRLPTRTRKAVQFLDGLRGQMVVAGKEQSHPEFFACPFAATQVQSYTFREVRQRFGDQWPYHHSLG